MLFVSELGGTGRSFLKLYIHRGNFLVKNHPEYGLQRVLLAWEKLFIPGKIGALSGVKILKHIHFCIFDNPVLPFNNIHM